MRRLLASGTAATSRISVAHIVNLVANGMTVQVVEELPDLEKEDVRQALAYAAALARDEIYALRARSDTAGLRPFCDAHA